MEIIRKDWNTLSDKGFERFDTLVLTGGLGPTKDDLTKHTVAKVLGKELVTDEASLGIY